MNSLHKSLKQNTIYYQVEGNSPSPHLLLLLLDLLAFGGRCDLGLNLGFLKGKCT